MTIKVNEMEGHAEVAKFGAAWEGSKNFKISDSGDYIFAADVIYESLPRGVEVQSCAVKIARSGVEAGSIEIYESRNLTNETHHLGFRVKWQRVEFDTKSRALHIFGSSEKMGGNYSVSLNPNAQEPSFI